MSVKEIVQIPSPMLKNKSLEIERVDAGVVHVAEDLLDTLNKHKALGLSAVQIGVPIRMFAISRDLGCPWSIIMNPKILMTTEDTLWSNEGCLSIGKGIPRFRVRRAKKLIVQAVVVQKKKGKWGNAFKVQMDVFGKASIVFQHEYDHLEGKLITDAEVGVPMLLAADGTTDLGATNVREALPAALPGH